MAADWQTALSAGDGRQQVRCPETCKTRFQETFIIDRLYLYLLRQQYKDTEFNYSTWVLVYKLIFAFVFVFVGLQPIRTIAGLCDVG